MIVAQPFDPSLMGVIEKAIAPPTSDSTPPTTARWSASRFRR
jgi:hypothetical protein